jgi:hypothetical protein
MARTVIEISRFCKEENHGARSKLRQQEPPSSAYLFPAVTLLPGLMVSWIENLNRLILSKEEFFA